MFTVWRLIVTILCVNLPGYCCLYVNPLKEDGRWGVRKEVSQGLLMHADDCTLTTPPQDPSPVWPDLILLGDNGEWVKWGKKMGEKKSITFRLSQRMPLHTVKWLWAKRVPFCEWWVFCSSLLQSYLPEWDIKSGHWMQMCCAAKCEKRILGEERPPRILLKICLHTHTPKHVTSPHFRRPGCHIAHAHIHTWIDVQMQTYTDFTHTCIFCHVGGEVCSHLFPMAVSHHLMPLRCLIHPDRLHPQGSSRAGEGWSTVFGDWKHSTLSTVDTVCWL